MRREYFPQFFSGFDGCSVLKIETSPLLEVASTRSMNILSSNGPAKSRCKRCLGDEGTSHSESTSFGERFLACRQSEQFLVTSSSWKSINGHHKLLRAMFFMRDTPLCSSWSNWSTASRSAKEMTTRLPHMMTPCSNKTGILDFWTWTYYDQWSVWHFCHIDTSRIVWLQKLSTTLLYRFGHSFSPLMTRFWMHRKLQ